MALQSPFFNNTGKRDAIDAQPVRPGSMVTPSAATVPAVAQPVAAKAPAQEVESKLTVGPNIKLKGVEITDCDTLLVEGSVEATMDSRVMQISERGSFRGSAEIDIAEIWGLFDGTLTVREKLVIHATGKVTGRVRYGKLVIEEGGQLSGDIEYGTSTTASRTPAAARTGLQQVNG
ncbi:MAG TPA: polymer-forming cytoskeletal protein [Ramlibacter sp.]|nr:polymer-forming cytoskeletal protein [Ramlibacter sp.]